MVLARTVALCATSICAASLAALPATASAQERVEVAEAPEEVGTHPSWGLLVSGLAIFGTAYVVASVTVFSVEATGECRMDDEVDTHAIPCDRRGLAFVPFAHWLGTGSVDAWGVGFAASFFEGLGLGLTLIGALLQRPNAPPPEEGEVRITSGPAGSLVGAGVSLRF